MDYDCIPLFNKYDVEKIEDVVYELSDDMKKRQAAGRVILVDDGKLQIGGFFRHVFFPSSGVGSYTQKATPYDDDKYVIW
jgi:predicted neutral ceramidase superfamily lipid hydrolase